MKTTQRPEVYQAILADLRSYLVEVDGGKAPSDVQPAEPTQPKGADRGPAAGPAAAPAQPTAEQRQAAEQLQQHRLKVIDSFEKHVKTLGDKEGLDADDLAAYSDAISREIGKDPEALKRLEQGKMADVERLFTLHHNQMVARLERWSKSLTAKKVASAASAPKIPAGGAPPAPAEPVKLPPAKDAEERVKRATALFRGETIQ